MAHHPIRNAMKDAAFFVLILATALLLLKYFTTLVDIFSYYLLFGIGFGALLVGGLIGEEEEEEANRETLRLAELAERQFADHYEERALCQG